MKHGMRVRIALGQLMAAGGTLGKKHWWGERIRVSTPEHLQRLGLVRMIPARDTPENHVRWVITDAGRAAYAEGARR